MNSFTVADAEDLGTITRLEDIGNPILPAADDIQGFELESLPKLPSEMKAHEAFSLPNTYAPTISLPNEILTQIFELGLSQPSRERMRHAFCVSQVSGYWRDVALGTPSLWNFICVADCQDRIELIKVLINRSSSRPLDIEFDSGYGSILPDQLALILPLAPRWHTLLVSAEDWRNISEFLASCAGLFVPILESFRVIALYDCDTDEEEEEGDNNLLVFQGGAPKLTHVEIEGVPLTSCQPPLSSVSSLQLRHPPPLLELDFFRYALMGSNHLTNLYIYGEIFNNPPPPTPTPIKMPSLRSLTISQTNIYHTLVILDSPGLECLDIGSLISIPFFETILQGNASRYSRLESLTFRNAACGIGQTKQIILSLPSIKRVSLESCNAPDRLLRHLIPGGGEVEELPWPLLETISLSRVFADELAVLCDIVAVRISRGRSLACLIIRGGFPELPMDKLSWLQERVRVEDYQVPLSLAP